MTTEAATWVRFTRLIPIEISVHMHGERTRQAVATLHRRGWTADDIAHATLLGVAGADRPALVIARRLTDLVDGDVPPPADPDVTPTPSPYDPTIHGRGTERAADWAARIRSELAERKTARKSQSQEASTEGASA